MNIQNAFVKILPIDYTSTIPTKAFLSSISINNKDIDEIFASYYTAQDSTVGYLLFKSNNELSNQIPYSQLSYIRDIKNSILIKEKTLPDNTGLYSCFFSSNDTLNLYKYIEQYININTNLAWENFNCTNGQRFSTIVHYKYLNALIDSIDFCDSDNKEVAKIMGNSDVALIDNEDKLIINFDNEKIRNALSDYDIILVADGHSRYDEDLWLTRFIDLNSDFFNSAFLEALTIADMQGKLKLDSSLNERGYAVCYSGFYFSNPYYREMTQTILKHDIPIIGYDIRPKIGDKYDRLREKIQAQNILNNYHKGQRIVVMAGGGHSSLYKSRNGYKHMGYILDSLSEDRIAQVLVINDTIYVNEKESDIKKIHYTIDKDRSAKNYHIKTERPRIVTLHKKDQYLKSGKIDIPELICIAQPNIDYSYTVAPGNYIEVRYDFKEELVLKKQICISK